MNKKFCHKCGTSIDETAEFCPNCGAPQRTVDNNQQKVNNNSSQESPITALKSMWDNMFIISGKSSRSQFWFGYLDVVILSFLINILFGMSHYEYGMLFVGSIVAAMITIAEFTNMVRRLHDANLSGHLLWLLLIPFAGWIAVIVLLCQPSKENNRKNVVSNGEWCKKWWTWLIIAAMTIVMFGCYKSYVNYVVYGIDNADTHVNNDNASNHNNDDSDNEGSTDNSTSESSDQEDKNMSMIKQGHINDFNMGPLKFSDFKYGILSEKNITGGESSDLFDMLGGAAPSSFYKQGNSYKQIMANYTITNTSNDSIHFDGIMDKNDLLMPDGTQLNQLDSDDFYSKDIPNVMEVKPGAKMNVSLVIQFKGDKANDIPYGNYQFKTAEVNDSDYNTVGEPINITLKF